MRNRRKRLEGLLKLQNRIKALHEMRHAGYVAEAAAAEHEASALIEAAQADESLHDLFPEIYQRRIAAAYERRTMNRTKAEAEAVRVSTETARADIVERSVGEAQRDDERRRLEREVLEAVEQLVKPT